MLLWQKNALKVSIHTAINTLSRYEGRIRCKKQKKRPGVICIEGNYHGRTLGAHLMSQRVTVNDWAGYQDPNIYHIQFPYPWNLQGSSGAAFLQSEMDALAKKEIDILLRILKIIY